jgi:AraC-like DNA-binding protein
MDVLSDVLGTLRLQSQVFASTELEPPWGMRAAPRDHFAFHIVARGSCGLDVDGGAPTPVSGGDVVVLSRGHAHALRDAPRSRARPIEELLASGAFSKPVRGAPGSTHIVCGCFRFDDLRSSALLAALPTVIHTHEMASAHGPWLAQTVKLLAWESARNHPGAETVISRLCDALFVYVIRSVLEQVPEGSTSWLRALTEPQVSTALRLMHENPAEPWSVASLAGRVGMSCSAFADKFTRTVGESPMQYLIRWRLEKAAGMLRGGEVGLDQVAARVGYDSAAAFNKAFKRSMGVTPGAYRKRAVAV